MAIDLSELRRVIELCRQSGVRAMRWGDIEIELAAEPAGETDATTDDYDADAQRAAEEEDLFAASAYRPPNLRALRKLKEGA